MKVVPPVIAEVKRIREIFSVHHGVPISQEFVDFANAIGNLCDAAIALAAAAVDVPVEAQGNRPTIICLCGLTRFIEQFAIKTWELEREGFIVLGCTLLPASYCKVPDHFGEATGTKEQCDKLHLRKIDLADKVLVLNVDGYIGESTRREIEYATSSGKPVEYLEAQGKPDAPTFQSHTGSEGHGTAFTSIPVPDARPVIGPNTHRGEDGSVSVLGTSTGVPVRPVTDEQKREMHNFVGNQILKCNDGASVVAASQRIVTYILNRLGSTGKPTP